MAGRDAEGRRHRSRAGFNKVLAVIVGVVVLIAALVILTGTARAGTTDVGGTALDAAADAVPGVDCFLKSFYNKSATC